MPIHPTSVVHNISRDEYAAIANPFTGQWKSIVIATIIGSAPASLFPLLMLGIIYGAMQSSPNAAWMAHRVITSVIMRMGWLFLALQAGYVIVPVSRVWSILGKNRAMLKRLFPDRNRRETITTQLLPIGVLQTSAGSSTIIPWGNVIRILEVSQGFILQTQNLPTMRWAASLENLYILKPNDPVEHEAISLGYLEDVRSASELLPNYLWQAGVFGVHNSSASQAVWPPPPASETAKPALGIPLIGPIHLPTFQVSCEGPKLSFKYGPSANLQRISGAVVVSAVFFFDFYRFLTASTIYLAIAVALVICGLFIFLIWRTSVYITVDRETSQMTVHGKRFASIAEIDSITVVGLRMPSFLGAWRKRAGITIRKNNGKTHRLPPLASTSAAEINIVAMILGEFLAESI